MTSKPEVNSPIANKLSGVCGFDNRTGASYAVVVLQRTKRIGLDSWFQGISPYRWPCRRGPGGLLRFAIQRVWIAQIQAAAVISKLRFQPEPFLRIKAKTPSPGWNDMQKSAPLLETAPQENQSGL